MSETRKLAEDVTLPTQDADMMEWLRGQMNEKRKWLLAHADDGVIWGRWDGDKIITSHDVAPDLSPPLRLVTLRQASLFGEDDELRLWRDERGFLARRIGDENGADVIRFDETQVLWGDAIMPLNDPRGFTHVREKKRQGGMDHVVPIDVSQDDLENRRLKLRVRHFVTYDQDTGEAHIALSRLISIEILQEGEL
jgi:CRISPR-associated protein (TIGR03984 family)